MTLLKKYRLLVLKLIALFGISTLLAPLMCNYFLNDLGISINMRINDLLIMALPRPASSGQVQVVGITPAAEPGYFKNRTATDLQAILQKMLDEKPLLVMSTFSLPVTNSSEKELRNFASFASKHPNLYFYTSFLPLDEGSLSRHPILGKLQYVFVPLTQDGGSDGDGRIRRLIIDFDVADPTIANPLMDMLGRHGMKREIGDYPLYPMTNSLQTMTRYRDPLLPVVQSLSDLVKNHAGKDRILILGPALPSDEEGGGWGTAINDEFVTVAQRVAMDLDTLILKDPVHRYLRDVRMRFAFVFVFLYLLGVLFLNPIRASIWGFAVIISYFFVAAFNLAVFNRLMYLMEVPVTLMVVHFFISPLLLIRHLRGLDRKLANLEMQKLRSSLVVKSARADQGLQIAVQVAHDMRSPLMALMIATEHSKEQLPPGAGDILQKSTQRLQRIADDLLKKFRTGDFFDSLAGQVVDIREVLEELQEAYEKSWTRLKIQIQCAPEASLKMADPPAFERAISNLLNNSLQAGLESPTGKINVRIEVRRTGVADSEMEILYSDDGPGVSVAAAEKLFERGHSVGKKEGSGLGLWQVRETFRSLGGDVELVKKSPGAHFRMHAPIQGNLGEGLIVHPDVILVEDNAELRAHWAGRFKALGAKVIALESPEALAEITLPAKFTLMTDLIFENSEQTGFNVLESVRGLSCQSILCSSLAANPDIQKMAAGLAQLVLTKNQFELSQLSLFKEGLK